MTFGVTLDAIVGLARIALAAIALVIAPIADTFTCGSEEAPAAAEMVADAGPSAHAATDQDDHKGQSSDFAHCVHGHCHSSMTSNHAAEQPFYAVAEAASPVRNASIALPSVSSGLERPPKA